MWELHCPYVGVRLRRPKVSTNLKSTCPILRSCWNQVLIYHGGVWQGIRWPFDDRSTIGSTIKPKFWFDSGEKYGRRGGPTFATWIHRSYMDLDCAECSLAEASPRYLSARHTDAGKFAHGIRDWNVKSRWLPSVTTQNATLMTGIESKSSDVWLN